MDARTNLWALVAIFLVFFIIAWALPGHCAYCAPYSCFDSSICGGGCFCAKVNGGLQGICVSLD